MSIWTAESIDDVCPKCGVPKDDHLVRDWRAHNPPAGELLSSDFRPFDQPSAVLIEQEPNHVQGVRIGAAVLSLPFTGKTLGVLTYQFMRADDSMMPVISYPANDDELDHVGKLTKTAIGQAIRGRKRYQPPKGDS